MIDYAAPDLSVPLSSRVAKGILRGLFWVGAAVFGYLVVGGLTVAFAAGVGRSSAYIGLVGGFLLLANWGVLMSIKRRTLARVVLQHVADCIRLGLPLPDMLEAAREGETRSVRKRLRGITAELRAGTPIAASLEKHLPALTLRARGLIAAGEVSGRLGAALPEAIVELRPAGVGKSNVPLNIGATGFLSLLVLLVLAMFVVPKFEMIARDFEVVLPERTQMLFAFARMLEGFTLSLLGLMVVTLMIVFARMGARVLLDQRARPAGWLRRTWLRVLWYLPVVGALSRDRAIADGLAVLADGVEQERPLPAALRSSAMPHLNDVFRERLYRWADASQTGVPLIEAARQAAMPATLIELLAVARQPSDFAGAARFVSRLHADRYATRGVLVRSLGSIALTLLAALLVWWIASSFILSMTYLIEHVNAEVR